MHYIFSLFFLLSHGSHQFESKLSPQNTLRITGSIYDWGTGMDLPIQAYAGLETGEKHLGSSDSQGIFNLEIPYLTNYLVFTSAGYRTIKIPTQFISNHTENKNYSFSLPTSSLDSAIILLDTKMYWHLPTTGDYKVKIISCDGRSGTDFFSKLAHNGYHSLVYPKIEEGEYLVSAYSSDENLLCNKRFNIKKGLNFFSFSVKPFHPEVSPGNVSSLRGRSFEIGFDQSSHVLRLESRALLDSIISILKDNPELKVELKGYSDNVGNYNKNMTLSEFRVRQSAIYIENKGIKSQRVSKSWYGSDNLVSKSNLDKNRRVVIELK